MNSLYICEKSATTTSSELSSISKHDHRKDRDEHIAIYQECADYISAITSDKNKIDHIQKGCLLIIINSKPSCDKTKTEKH